MGALGMLALASPRAEVRIVYTKVDHIIRRG